MTLFILSAIGLTLIIVESSILAPVRAAVPKPLKLLVTCYMCTGFWSGLFCGALLGLPLIPCAFAGSFVSQLGATMLSRLER